MNGPLFSKSDRELFNRLNASIHGKNGRHARDDTLSYYTSLKNRLGATKYDGSSNSLSTRSSSMDSVNSLCTNSSSSMNSLKEKPKGMRHRDNFDQSNDSLNLHNFDDHDDDYADNVSTDTYSCKSEYTGTDYYDSDDAFYNVMYENSGYERAETKTGVHLPMLDEYFIKDYTNYTTFKNSYRKNSVKEKIYKHMPFLRKFFKEIDTEVESEIRRYLDIKEREKQNYPVRKVKGTQKIFNFLSKYRAFIPLVVLGIFSLFLLSSVRIQFLAFSPILSLLVSASTYWATPLPILLVISSVFYFMILVWLGGYGLLVFHFVRKLKKIKRLRRHIKEFGAMRNEDDD
ncbi:Uncharacterized protein PCOAH_00000130 [Plasmodium coatneyi]|uniref:Pv-fam-d protein n=1 Tax=Plasmodium coatneyi TaxID=208452 RepID=A0A1B1DTC1_9APIC|nr:Uncharacterized protein PCOAH_00000130 [Plasmodium coatneyi]ANQ05835.1 Uncharacterized protein PCOAH_00000130 [Plasmodium coatneyi]